MIYNNLVDYTNRITLDMFSELVNEKNYKP